MGTINSPSILQHLKDHPPVETVFQLIQEDGTDCRKIGVDELRALASLGHVCARWRGKTIRCVQLIIPTDEAFQSLGETVRKVRGALESSQASQTTQRASENMPGYFKRHHAAHCSSFAGARSWAGPVDARCV
jgi:hypothetical protein